MPGRIFFWFLTLIAVGTSGVLTYLGAVNLYQGIPFMQYVLMALIGVYICSIAFFWSQLYAFVSIPQRSFWHRLQLFAVSAVVLVFVWFTSTYFNIISLSGMLVTSKQIQHKLESLDYELIASLEEERRQVQKIHSLVLSLAAATQVSADNELDLDGWERESSKGPMFSAYNVLGQQLAVLADRFDEHAYNLGDILQKDTRQAMHSFRRAVSAVRFLQLRQEMVEREVIDLQMAYTRKQAASRYTESSQTDSSANSVPDFVKAAVAEESTDSTVQAEQPAAENEVDPFLAESQQRVNTFQHYLNLLTSTLRLSSPVIVWEVRDRYHELLAQSIRDLMTEVPSPAIYVPSVNALMEAAQHHLETARLRLRNPAALSPAIAARTEYHFIPFLQTLIANLEQLKSKLERQSDNGNNQDVGRDSEFYRNLQLESIDTAVWKKEYRSIPLIALAVLIDYILIPILIIRSVVTKAHDRQQKRQEKEAPTWTTTETPQEA